MTAVVDKELTAADLKVGDRFTMPDNGFGKTYTLTKPDWAVSDDQEMMTQLRGIERVVRALPKQLKFEVTVYDDNVYGVWAVTPDDRDKIAEVMWNGAEWIFMPCDQGGFIVGPDSADWRVIDVDPERRLHLNEIEAANVASRALPDTNETVQAALDLALDKRRREFRDDSREDAILGARLFARGWYPKWRDL